MPVFYSSVSIVSLPGLEQFFHHLKQCDSKWDSIRRSPYSAPGRWVQVLDLSLIPVCSKTADMLHQDSLLTQLFPLVPFMSHLMLNSDYPLSRRAVVSLTNRAEIRNLRSIEGFRYIPWSSSMEEDVTVHLLQQAHGLESLEIIGPGVDPLGSEVTWGDDKLELRPSFQPLYLPNLHCITLESMHSSTLMFALLNSPLPSLSKLTLTPYEGYPNSLVSQFIQRHGAQLRTLVLFTPKAWPTLLHRSPTTLLLDCPSLRHLSLETPLPTLTLSSPDHEPLKQHPLEILSISRPTTVFYKTLDHLLPSLPKLKAVRARDVRWLRKGMTMHAQAAGVQGELREWSRRLRGKGVRVLDADWKDCE